MPNEARLRTPTENNAIAAAMTDVRRCEGHSTAIDSSTAVAATLTRRITVSMFRGLPAVGLTCVPEDAQPPLVPQGSEEPIF